ncbi:MAG: hypothetical protein DI529_08270 [Chryseobacterium sp.]|nr:MAG: hypothetical protein DI529_08270 [Chryseobacterium sp.]
MTTLSLYKKIENLSPALRKEAEDFIEFLLDKTKKKEKTPKKPKKTFGSLKGKVSLSEDFDSPLEDFKDYM